MPVGVVHSDDGKSFETTATGEEIVVFTLAGSPLFRNTKKA